MHSKCRLGVVSLVLGALSLTGAAVLFQIDRFIDFDPNAPAIILGLLDRMGLVNAPDMQAAVVLSPAYVTSINDSNAIEFLRLHVWWLGSWAIGVALWAESRKEETLYLSIGFLLGCLGVSLLNQTVGVIYLIFGGVMVSLIRRRVIPSHSTKRASSGKP
ncbi:hypothetical protein KIH07_09225 [Hydrogenophaga taeniospiralis]|uniref:hypothetical protein n=1 Tax=Hydrogenophaga taeniospiralis TaxID=65656 RepID=UPI001CFB2B40|nr:hypothetical protein [Hydrogenophaga taeniospiralis]MCB4363914.1 hypothetical protein [Hydrogenophaga taeniospiralis]